MKLLVADRFEKHALEELRHMGAEVVYEPEIGKDGLAGKLANIGVVIVRDTPVPSSAIEAGAQLNLIVRAGAGTAGIDVQAASARGVYVAHCPGKNAIAVAELAMGLVMAIDRRIPDAVVALRAGTPPPQREEKSDGLYGKTIGLAGFGPVAREVAVRARAFGMNVMVWSRNMTAARAAEHGVGFAKSIDDLASKCQVLSLHLPLSSATRGLVDAKVLAALPDRAIVINTARPELVDHPALERAILEKKLRVGLDVYPDEPQGKEGTPSIFAVDGVVYGTPHVGAQTIQAESAITAETVRIVRAFLHTGAVPNCVNVAHTSPARYQMVVRSLDKVGVLANVLGVVKRHGLNIEELSSTIFDGAIAACTKIRLTGRPSDACVNEIKAFSEVLHVDVVPLPNMA